MENTTYLFLDISTEDEMYRMLTTGKRSKIIIKVTENKSNEIRFNIIDASSDILKTEEEYRIHGFGPRDNVVIYFNELKNRLSCQSYEFSIKDILITKIYWNVAVNNWRTTFSADRLVICKTEEEAKLLYEIS